MGEEEKKKVEEKEVEGEGKKKQEAAGGGSEKKEEKKGEGDGGEKKAEGGGDGEGEKKETPPPPPPEELVMRVYMHCEGCARKVKRCLKGFEGVEDVTTDCRTQRVVVKGKVAAADPLRVVDRVERKTGRKVELLTPIPPKPEKKEEKKVEEEKPKPEEKKKEEPPVLSVVLKVHMHCEACSQEIKKRILKMKGVESAEPELKSSQVTVKGVFDPPKLVEYVYKRTGKHAVVVKAEAVGEKAGDGKGKGDGKGEEKAPAGGGEGEKDKAEGAGGAEGEKAEGAGGGEDATAAAMAAKLGELTRNPLFYQYTRYPMEYTYPPQIFSDENPNACAVM